MLLFQAINQRRCTRITKPEQLEQIGIFLGVVQPLQKRIDVMNHCLKEDEIGLDSHVADLAYYVEHAVQHCRERAVLLLDNVFRLHGISLHHRCRSVVGPRRVTRAGARAPDRLAAVPG